MVDAILFSGIDKGFEQRGATVGRYVNPRVFALFEQELKSLASGVETQSLVVVMRLIAGVESKISSYCFHSRVRFFFFSFFRVKNDPTLGLGLSFDPALPTLLCRLIFEAKGCRQGERWRHAALWPTAISEAIASKSRRAALLSLTACEEAKPRSWRKAEEEIQSAGGAGLCHKSTISWCKGK